MKNVFVFMEIVWIVSVTVLSMYWLLRGAFVDDPAQMRDGIILGAIFCAYAAAVRSKRSDVEDI